MDLVDLIAEKRFVGQEFLTWLWWKSDQRGGTIALPERGDIAVVFEKHMLLEYGEAEYSERLLCSGLQTELKEARTGLRTGKKLEQARIRLAAGEYEYNVTIAAGLMEYRSVKLPKTGKTAAGTGENDLELEGMVLERIFLFEELVRLIDELFYEYVKVRTSQDWLSELQRIRTWVDQSAAAV